MSEFLKRNKKKGALAFLLLLFQRGKGLGPLLVLLLILSFMFVAPSGTLLHVPWLDEIGKRLGLRSGLGSDQDSSDLAGFADGVRGGKGVPAGLGLIGGIFGLGRGANQYGKSTVDMVKGGKELGGGESYVDGVAKSGKSVGGVLRPEDSNKIENGVALSEDEMQGGLGGQGDLAKAMQGGEGLKELRERLAGGTGASSSGFTPRAADRGSDMMRNAFGNSKLPNGLSPKGASGSQLGWKNSGRPSAAMGKSSLSGAAGSKSVMYQLAEGKAYSVAAAPPPGHCDPGACPSEFASNAGGAVFDGGRVKGDILTASEFGDPGINVPDQSSIDTLVQQAQQSEQDAKKCEAAEEQYGPQERQHMEAIQNYSNQLNAMDCGSGGCSKSKYQACMAVGDKMRGECNQYNSVAALKAQACPLMDGKSSQMDCSQ